MAQSQPQQRGRTRSLGSAGRAYVGGLFGAGGPPADIGSDAVVFCCSAQESDAVAKVAAIIADASREMILFSTSISFGVLLEREARISV